jgi:hypothetical protein
MRPPGARDGAVSPYPNVQSHGTVEKPKEGATVSIGASPLHAISVASAIEVDVGGRWDALDLSELLVPFHSFLVQETPERWVVHARAPGCHGEPLADAVRAIEEWSAERGLGAMLRVEECGPSR